MVEKIIHHAVANLIVIDRSKLLPNYIHARNKHETSVYLVYIYTCVLVSIPFRLFSLSRRTTRAWRSRAKASARSTSVRRSLSIIHSFLPFYIFFTSIKSFRDLITSISRKLFDEISGYSIKMETESSTKRQASIPPAGIDGGRLSLPLVL